MKTEPRRALTSDEQEYAIKTWRYLRMGMVGLVVGLAASIVYEWSANDFECVQKSISAYYYTPVRAFFVAALVGIGVALFCLKGSTAREDILLNLAGMFAPLVAFVPTSDPNRCTSSPVPVPIESEGAQDAATRAASIALKANIDNNVTALLVVGLLAALWLAARRRGELLQWPNSAGYGAAAFVWLVLTAAFVFAPDFFRDNAHNVTAVAMFACIFVVVWDNAIGHEKNVFDPRNPYAWIGALMALSAVATGLAVLIFGKGYSVLIIEIAFITLFTIFWLIQTRELREAGLRAPVIAAGS